MSEFKVFTFDQLTNDEYHDPKGWAAEYVSGSNLAEIFATCPAAWKFKKREETKALVFGTQSHTNFQSAELFEQEYRRATDPEDVKDLITSQAAFAEKLKSFGLTGTSGKTYPDLIKIMVDSGLDLNVLWLIEMIEECQARADAVQLVPAKYYDACVTMRRVLENIPEHNACMNSPTAQRELSIFGTIGGVKVKVRLDHVDVCSDVSVNKKTGIDPDGFPIYETVVYDEAVVITDYKTTASANPKDFSRSAFDHGYYLKMALQHDLFKRAYPGEKRPVIVRLLAQEKKEPFLPIAFRLTDEQLQIGRLQYMGVINQFAECQALDVWPGYSNNAVEVELETPAWIRKQYEGFL